MQLVIWMLVCCYATLLAVVSHLTMSKSRYYYYQQVTLNTIYMEANTYTLCWLTVPSYFRPLWGSHMLRMFVTLILFLFCLLHFHILTFRLLNVFEVQSGALLILASSEDFHYSVKFEGLPTKVWISWLNWRLQMKFYGNLVLER